MIIGLTSPLLLRNPHIRVVGQRAEIFKKTIIIIVIISFLLLFTTRSWGTCSSSNPYEV